MECPTKTDINLTDCGLNKDTWDTVLPILYLLLFTVALLLNGVVAWICLLIKSDSSFMVYLKHLVAADLLMTVTLPIKAASMLLENSSELQMVACRFTGVFFYLAMDMSTILLGLISFDRFLKIVRPGRRFPCQNLIFSKVLTTCVWILLFGSSTLPIIITTDQYLPNKCSECMDMKSDLGREWHKRVIILSMVIFWLVGILIVFCYVCITKKVLASYRNSHSTNNQAKNKTKTRVFLILAIFIICYLPYHSVRIPYTILQYVNDHSCYKNMLKNVKDLTLWISSTNICLDPLIYFFLCTTLRNKFTESFIFKCFTSMKNKSQEMSSVTSS